MQLNHDVVKELELNSAIRWIVFERLPYSWGPKYSDLSIRAWKWSLVSVNWKVSCIHLFWFIDKTHLGSQIIQGTWPSKNCLVITANLFSLKMRYFVFDTDRILMECIEESISCFQHSTSCPNITMFWNRTLSRKHLKTFGWLGQKKHCLSANVYGSLTFNDFHLLSIILTLMFRYPTR